MRILTLLIGTSLIVTAVLWREPPSPSPTVVASPELSQLLHAQNYALASEQLRTDCRSDTSRWIRCRLQLLEYAASRVDGNEAGSLLPLIALLLEYSPDDAPAQLLRARAQLSQGQLDAALTIFAVLRNQALRDDEALAPYGNLEQLFNETAERRLVELRQRQAWLELTALLQRLGELDPDNGKWFYQLAKNQFRNHRLEAARASLHRIYYHPQWGERAQALEREHLSADAAVPQPAPQPNATHSRHHDNGEQVRPPIPLRRRGSHFIVKLQVGTATLPFLIDTGASLTVIDSGALQRSSIAYRHRGLTDMKTAGGIVRVQLVQVDSLGIEEQLIDKLVIATTDMSWLPGASGLLGMDYLRYFDFRIDAERAQLYLKRP